MPSLGEIDYSGLPDHMQEATKRYIERGGQVGIFLTEVFSNRLVQAYSRADEMNQAFMKMWVSFLYNEAPRGCWGSPEAVEEWQRRGGLEGIQRERDRIDAESSVEVSFDTEETR